jgi:hypothetical protein
MMLMLRRCYGAWVFPLALKIIDFMSGLSGNASVFAVGIQFDHEYQK